MKAYQKERVGGGGGGGEGARGGEGGVALGSFFATVPESR